MKRVFLFVAFAGILAGASCKKDDNVKEVKSFDELKTLVIQDFVNKVAVPQYKALDDAATDLQQNLQNLYANATEENLSKARTSWTNMRGIWEQCEGFLFGPVEDNDYDPNMDTWPTDYRQMDSLLASSNPLEVSDIAGMEGVALSLRGYHPIEYIIFGDHGNRTATSITDRQKKYMLSLSIDLKNTCHALYTSWTEQPTYFAQTVLTAGYASNSRFETRQQVYHAIVGGMIDICEEVGESKMLEPYDAYVTDGAAVAAGLVESPYSGNSLKDFKNNIIGLRNVYVGINNSYGLSDLVSAKNKELDNKIKNQINQAVSSFDNVTVYYETAIGTQRQQVQGIMDALATLKATLEDELTPFITQYITD